MLFPDSFINELKQRTAISKVVGIKVKLQRKGGHYIGLCPFHQEKTPSFTVSDQKGSYYCFGCHAHGDVIKFISETEHLSFSDTVSYLANFIGIQLPKLSVEDAKKIENHNALLQVLDKASKWFSEQLRLSSNYFALEYLEKRGISVEYIKHFYLGYAPAKGLVKYLQTEGYSKDLMIQAGLCLESENKQLVERFKDRIIFPIMNQKNHVVGFGGRSLDSTKMPKYLNSPETIVFKKNNIFYGTNLAYKNILHKERIIVVEGYIDTIFMHKAGFNETVAALGTAFNQTHLQNLWRLSNEPILCFDGDNAGKKAMIKAAHVALPILTPGLSLKFCLLPKNKDPDEIINLYGSDYMNDLIERSISLSDFIWQSEEEQYTLDGPENRALFEHKIYDLVDQIQNTVVKGHYRQFMRNKLWQKFNSFSKNKNVKIVQIKPITSVPLKTNSLKERLEYSLFAQLISYPFLIEEKEIFEIFVEINLSNPELEKLRESIIKSREREDIYLNDLLIEKKLDRFISFLCGPESSFIDIISDIDNNTARTIWLITYKKYFLEILKEEYNQVIKKAFSENTFFEKADELKKLINKVTKEVLDRENTITAEE